MLKVIPSAQLRVGMFLHKLQGNWVDHPFWRSSFLIADKKPIKAIIDSGIVEVIIDTAKGKDIEATPPPSQAKTAKTPAQSQGADKDNKPASVSMEAEWQRAQSICLEAKDAVASMFREVRMGNSIQLDEVKSLVADISGSVTRNPETLISIARLKSADDYTYLHSVAVSAMMIALAKQLGLSQAVTEQAALGGLLHDVGKALMPMEVLNKAGKLTDDEYAIIKTHPAQGYKLLLAGGAVNPESLDVVLHHHEKFDGTGYPDQLAGEEISLLARMGAVCDVYDAITSNRPYKSGWEPSLSIKRMSAWEGHFDPVVLKAFIKTLGIYPAGSLVKLASGKLGVVLEQNQVSLLKPRLKVFLSTKPKGPIAIEELDLSSARCQEFIVSLEDPAQWGFKKLDELWMPI